jgi:hypothetical protein
MIIYLYSVSLKRSKLVYLIFNLTPDGTPAVTAKDKLLCLDTFFSAPYSTTPPNVPTLVTI